MSILQYELMQTTSGLSDESLKIILDYVRTFIVPFDQNMEPANETINEVPHVNARKLGSRKGLKFVADGHDIDEYNDEIEELFGVNI